jgi:hypothetical protein
MDVLVIGLWLSGITIAGLAFAKGVLLHMKHASRNERQRRRQDDLIIVADPDSVKTVSIDPRRR